MRKRLIRGKKARYGSVTAILTVLIIAVTVLANAVFNVFSDRYLWYGDMRPSDTYDVTDECFDLLRRAAESAASETGSVPEIEILFCDTEENLLADSSFSLIYETAATLADGFDWLSVSCHDVWTNPDVVRPYTTTYNPITGEAEEKLLSNESVIVVSGTNYRIFDLIDFFVFSEEDASGQAWAYDGEKKLAAAILRIFDSGTHIACLTNNHGEVVYDYELLYLLDDAGYVIYYMDLYHDEIPAECDLIISCNPNTDLIDDALSETSERTILEDFLAVDGHSFFVFLENGTPSLPNFEKFLEDWGVETCKAVNPQTGLSYRYMVQDPSQSLTSDGYTIYAPAVSGDASARITDGLDRGVIFKNATALRPAQGFVNAGDGSYSKGDRRMIRLYEGGKNASSWTNGSIADLATPTLMTLTEQSTGTAVSHVCVISSVGFFSEEFLQSAVYGNGEVLMRLLKISGKEYLPEGLIIKPFASLTMSTVTTAQMLRWTILLVSVPVVLCALTGVFILVRRRRA